MRWREDESPAVMHERGGHGGPRPMRGRGFWCSQGAVDAFPCRLLCVTEPALGM